MKEYEVVCAVIVESRTIFACKRNYNKILGGKWEFPGGKVEPGENPEDTIKREIKEELNSVISPYEYLGCVEYNYDDLGEDNFHIKLHAYLCNLESGMLELKEHIAGYFMSYDKLLRLDFLPADKEILKVIGKYFKH